jgi:hypothetical protein
MKNILIVGLIVIGTGAGFAGGVYFSKKQVTSNKLQVATPNPTPDTSKFTNTKATVKSFDGKKLVYTLEDKTERTIENVASVKVWQKPTAPETKATETSWNVVKPGTKLTIATDVTTRKIVGVLVL